jgi:glycopeptide antibiotics resistance protein
MTEPIPLRATSTARVETAPESTGARSSSATAARLGFASLAYLLAITLVVTLTPFRFLSSAVHGLTSEWTTTDLVMNVVMFVPLGFLFSLSRANRQLVVPLAFILGLALSAAIESAQMFELERYTSLLDVMTNGIGALVGALVHDLLLKALSRVAVGDAPVRALALELPLMGLVYLLVPLMWLVGLGADSTSRIWLALPVTVFGGAIIGAVHGGYLMPLRGTSRATLIAVTSAWAAIAGVMVMRKSTTVFVACIVIAVIAAFVQSVRAFSAQHEGRNRRFELPTLHVVLPVFAAYVALSALWPLNAADLTWRYDLHFFPAGSIAHGLDIYRALEHIAAFTLVGYVIAELSGRAERPYRDMAPRIALWGSGVALLLEVARGFHPMYGASGLLWVVTSLAALFGGWMYYLQRDHVRALTLDAVVKATAGTREDRVYQKAA